MPCYSPLHGWRDEFTGGIKFRRGKSNDEDMSVACGQCLGCRLDRSRHWAMRIVHEAAMVEESGGSSCFVTLTYRNEWDCDERQRVAGLHVPEDWSLSKRVPQLFFKRLRKRFGAGIRYFQCGEYGSVCRHGIDLSKVRCPLCSVGRPHYHAVLFNCSFDDLEPYEERLGELRFTSPTLEAVWGYGFVDVGAVTFESAAYVARYALKKVTGVRADEHYAQVNEDGSLRWVQPEFCTMSRGAKGGHGIGYDWFQKYKSDVFPSNEVPVPGSGVFKSVPRYYDELFALEDPLSMEQIKEVRRKFAEENASEYSPERLMSKYKVKKAQVQMLKRTIS